MTHLEEFEKQIAVIDKQIGELKPDQVFALRALRWRRRRVVSQMRRLADPRRKAVV